MGADVSVRAMGFGDLEALLAWRNHPDVRRYMLTSHEISLDEHRGWFERASTDASRRLLIVEQCSRPLGFVHFSSLSASRVVDWGFYATPGAPRGTGTVLGEAALDWAFTTLDLLKVCGQALCGNGASIRLHLALGFRLEGTLRAQYPDHPVGPDLVCFGLLREEWFRRRTAGAEK